MGPRIRSTLHTSGAWGSTSSAGGFPAALPTARPSVGGRSECILVPGCCCCCSWPCCGPVSGPRAGRGLGGGAGSGLSLEPLSPSGSPAQDLAFSLQVPRVVTAQEGLCVRVPCTLSYPQIGWTDETPALGYWFLVGTESNIGRPVATNDQNRAVQTVPQDRFQLVGDPQNRSCSLLIREAQVEDSALYFFRVERGHFVRYNFMKNQFYLEVTGVELTGGRGEWEWGLSSSLPFPPPTGKGGLWGTEERLPPAAPPSRALIVPFLCPSPDTEARHLRPRDPGARKPGDPHLCV